MAATSGASAAGGAPKGDAAGVSAMGASAGGAPKGDAAGVSATGASAGGAPKGDAAGVSATGASAGGAPKGDAAGVSATGASAGGAPKGDAAGVSATGASAGGAPKGDAAAAGSVAKGEAAGGASAAGGAPKGEAAGCSALAGTSGAALKGEAAGASSATGSGGLGKGEKRLAAQGQLQMEMLLAQAPLAEQILEEGRRKAIPRHCSAPEQELRRGLLELPPRTETSRVPVPLALVELAAGQTDFPAQVPQKERLLRLQADQTAMPEGLLPLVLGQKGFGKASLEQLRAEPVRADSRQTEMLLPQVPQVPVETDSQRLAPVEQVEMGILEEALQSSVAVCFGVLESAAGWLVGFPLWQRLDGTSQGIQR